jgi:hypothetical protein
VRPRSPPLADSANRDPVPILPLPRSLSRDGANALYRFASGRILLAFQERDIYVGGFVS